MLNETLVSLDLETTGLKPEKDEIIEIGAVKFRGGEVVSTFNTLVNPYRPLPKAIAALTGLTQQEIAQAPPFAAIAQDLVQFIGTHPLVGQNVAFDIAFLARKGLALTAPAYDTYELASILLPTTRDYSLSSLAQALDVPHPRPHRALPDAEAARQVLLKLFEMATGLKADTLDDILRITQGSDGGLRRFFQLAAEQQQQSFALRPSRSGFDGLDLERLSREIEPLKSLTPAKPPEGLPVDGLTSMLAGDGAIAQHFANFEHRPEQVQMLQAVANTFNDGGQLVVEAGTGVGKSLAYLVPSMSFALKNSARVVISTHTINLQEQLIGKDIPTVLGCLSRARDRPLAALPWHDFRFATLKGRANYLCLHRWDRFRVKENMSQAETRFAAKLAVWLQDTQTGDKAELNLNAQESRGWDHVAAHHQECNPERCTYHKRGLCFITRARRRAEGAHVLVVNHALLLTDAVTGGGLIPSFEHLVMDEAHHLEEVATDQLGYILSETALMELLEGLIPEAAPQGAGILHACRTVLRSSALSQGQKSQGEAVAEQAEGSARNARDRAGQLLRLLSDLGARNARDSGGYERKVSINTGLRAQPHWAKVELAWENLDLALRDLLSHLDRLQTYLKALGEGQPAPGEALQADLSEVNDRLAEFQEHLAEAIIHPDTEMVYWLSTDPGTGTRSVHAAPLNPGPAIRDRLFSPLRSLILTSATLSTGGTFKYLKERLSLEDADDVLLGSPFDYRKAALLCVPEDLPEPTHSDYPRAVADAVLSFCQAAGGYSLALFTSYSTLKAVAEAVREPLEAQGIRVLAQGADGSARQIVNTFKSQPKGVLLGTSSLWEGVDLGGGTLRLLILTRLPFPVPTDPVFLARSDLFEEPFSQFTVPQAVLRFKQGFGRLIRSKQDRGAVVVLDSRIRSKGYGALFLSSIPNCTTASGPCRALTAHIQRWLRPGA